MGRQIAGMVATDGRPEPNVDPLERMRLEELVRVADLHVSDATGLSTSIAGGVLTVLPVTRADWAGAGTRGCRHRAERQLLK